VNDGFRSMHNHTVGHIARNISYSPIKGPQPGLIFAVTYYSNYILGRAVYHRLLTVFYYQKGTACHEYFKTSVGGEVKPKCSSHRLIQ